MARLTSVRLTASAKATASLAEALRAKAEAGRYDWRGRLTAPTPRR